MKLMVPFMMVVVVLIILVRGKRREFVNYFFALGEIPKSNSSNGEEHEYIQTTYHFRHTSFLSCRHKIKVTFAQLFIRHTFVVKIMLTIFYDIISHRFF